MTDEEAVLATLEEYSEAYCSKDVDRLMTLFDDGDNISLIGIVMYGRPRCCKGKTDLNRR
jgi:predicted mannosyl-3-phosphoglycerate phosphatase (HAD superfamily)